jgi:uncharacterized protein (DUF1800 family)
MKSWACVIGIWLLAAAPCIRASTHDHLFANGFDVPADAPASNNDAARFLTQATFGPTPTDIGHLMAVGYGEWIDEQLGKSATLGEATVESVVNARTLGGQNVNNTQRLNRWFWQATYAPDQLRQRMAWALSQIFVVSDQASAIGSKYVVPLTQYQDLLAQDAFALYRQLLGDVTWHPMMGRYLNAYHNLKPSASTSPDENYAREVMQLFSIGLIERNLDFSPVLSGGLTVPTYDQTVITHTAKVFTGFTWSDAPLSPPNFYGGGLSFATQYAPMACWGIELVPPLASNKTQHDITGDDGTTGTPKSVLDGQTIPANQTCAQDVSDELDILAAHQNVAPFISRQLIQRFVTSNPSPAYVQRVATVFENSTGDLGDVLKAILLDTEARNPPALAGGDSYGKLREPILRLTAMWRAFNAAAPAADVYGEVKMIGSTSFLGSYAQAPLESPTVFNFYLPDYQQPGAFAANDLYSPEFQITNESTTYTVANSYYSFTEGAYQGMSSPPTDRPLIDLSALTVNASNPTALVATVNADMLYGSMSAAMQSSLVNMINFLNGATPEEKAWSAIYVTMLSPEYAAQR